MPTVIAIDGPAGSGKSTLARNLAEALGLAYLNTGLMYRAVSAAALDRGVGPDDGEGLTAVAGSLRFSFGGSSPPALIVGGSNGPPLESPEVEAIVSRVSGHPGVRRALRKPQRELGLRGAVVEGRDIATVVFPDADVKIFITASPEVRARRRALERGGEPETVGGLVQRRDALDSMTNPLEPASGAQVIDSTMLTRDEVLKRAMGIVDETLHGGPAGSRGGP